MTTGFAPQIEENASVTGVSGRWSSQEAATPPVCPVCGEINSSVKYAACKDLLFATPGEFDIIECENCGGFFCDPPITPEQFGVYYPGSYYPSAGQILGARESFTARTARKMLKAFWQKGGSSAAAAARSIICRLSKTLRDAPPLQGNGRLLEVGCSSGERLLFLKDYGWRVEGIEPSSEACKEAHVLGLNVWNASLEDVDLPAGFYDMIELRHVFEHLGDPMGSIIKLRDALAPNGKILLTTPNANSLGRRIFGKFWRGLEVPRHYVVYTPQTFETLCASVGLRVRRVEHHVSPEVIVGCIKFVLTALRRRRRMLVSASTTCGSRRRSESKGKNAIGKLARKCLALMLIIPTVLGFGEVMQVEIQHASQ